MCLLVFCLNPEATSEEYYLVLINVRDEFYQRPTKVAHIWEKHPTVVAGMEIEPFKEGGTWFAMSKTGKIAALLNILQPDEEISTNKKGRGFLVVDYVTSSDDSVKYLQDISKDGHNYNGFTLVTMDLSSFNSPKIAYCTNSSKSPETLKPGIHAFGNSTSVECPWPKVKIAKENLLKSLKNSLVYQQKIF